MVGGDIQQGPLSGLEPGSLRLHTLSRHPPLVLLVFTFLMEWLCVMVSDMKNDMNALCATEEAEWGTAKSRRFLCQHVHLSQVQKHL